MHINIEKYESPIALLEEGQYCEQRPILLEIDWVSEKITAFTRDKNSGITAREWNGFSNTYRLTNNVDATKLSDWVQDEIVPIADNLLTVFSTEWDGNNRRGVFAEALENGDKVSHLKVEIERLCSDDREVPQLQGDGPGLWDVREWAAPTKEELNTETTDEQIVELVKSIEDAATDENVVLCGPNLQEWLTVKRDELIDEMNV